MIVPYQKNPDQPTTLKYIHKKFLGTYKIHMIEIAHHRNSPNFVGKGFGILATSFPTPIALDKISYLRKIVLMLNQHEILCWFA
jgi:hypothetical protein